MKHQSYEYSVHRAKEKYEKIKDPPLSSRIRHFCSAPFRAAQQLHMLQQQVAVAVHRPGKITKHSATALCCDSLISYCTVNVPNVIWSYTYDTASLNLNKSKSKTGDERVEANMLSTSAACAFFIANAQVNV